MRIAIKNTTPNNNAPNFTHHFSSEKIKNVIIIAKKNIFEIVLGRFIVSGKITNVKYKSIPQIKEYISNRKNNNINTFL
ncbi:hypothetical protein ACFVAD_06430 [Sutcliffiella sp. NPDC057660]|uniref:hypothetical protein n=1 Tax=Sutcliffiella sp. NPDC057660 TaxID=3346199 RepID=UPI0036768586